jgi:hypothetical protein
MSKQPWQEAFLGVSVILGETLEGSHDALGESATIRAGELHRGLRSSSREVRARTIARAVAAVVVGLDDMRLGR